MSLVNWFNAQTSFFLVSLVYKITNYKRETFTDYNEYALHI